MTMSTGFMERTIVLEVDGRSARRTRKSSWPRRTGMTSTTQPDQTATRNISTAMRRFGRFGNGKIGYTPTVWLAGTAATWTAMMEDIRSKRGIVSSVKRKPPGYWLTRTRSIRSSSSVLICATAFSGRRETRCDGCVASAATTASSTRGCPQRSHRGRRLQSTTTAEPRPAYY